MPNLAHNDVPIGKDEKSNKLIKKKGNIKKFSFEIKSHVELGAKNGKILILKLQLNYLDQDL